ncbi:hypothetical protein [Kineococcus indalonis]|uniref:hypothetical protein n=1 Tax=Kineococcus indalonis TaxID=2696566 RepID=UPI0014120FCA|nr:hypothetical protein [Kineococcus indalonis]NAZ86473.1 hypothetical protein [Kineococcus indalonis]
MSTLKKPAPAPSRPPAPQGRTSAPAPGGTWYVVAATGGYREPRFASTADRDEAVARYEGWADEADPWTGERVDLVEITSEGCRSLLQNTGATAPPF